MKVLLAPDSFKGALAARDAAEAMQRGAERAGATTDVCPLADGGEGTVDAIVHARGGEWREREVTGPLGDRVKARWGYLPDTRSAVIEMAAAAGLHHVPRARRDPTRTTSYGVGELIRAALDAGAETLIVGVGGSATTDGGAGMAQALGVAFETHGSTHSEPLSGGDLATLDAIALDGRDPRLAHAKIVVASDVDNPLTGEQGAARVYAPQKGATPEQVAALDRGLAHLAELLKTQGTEPGDGAAGGLGFGLRVFCGAELTSGIDLVLDQVGFDERMAACDVVLTGEGRIDGQSLRGKTVIGAARRAAQHAVPTIALVGSVGPDAERTLDAGLTAYFAIADGPMSEAEAMRRTAELLERAALNLVRVLMR